MRRITITIGLISSVLAGCVPGEPNSPTPTPDIEATVTAMVATQVAELMTASPNVAAPGVTHRNAWTLLSSTDPPPTTYQELLAAATNAIEEVLTEGVTLTSITLTETNANFTASAETVDQAIIFVETLRAAGHFGTVPFPRPVTEINASLTLGVLPEALRLAIAAVPTATHVLTPTPTGIIRGLAYIRTWVWTYTDDADPDFDGIDIYLGFRDSERGAIQFTGVPVLVTVKLYWDMNSLPIYWEQVTISRSLGISEKLLRIPFEDFEQRHSNVTAVPIVKVLVTTTAQGDFTNRPGSVSFWLPTPTPGGVGESLTPSAAFWSIYDSVYLRLPNDEARMSYRCSNPAFDFEGIKAELWTLPCESELARIARELALR